jgi:hypothetical protein
LAEVKPNHRQKTLRRMIHYRATEIFAPNIFMSKLFLPEVNLTLHPTKKIMTDLEAKSSLTESDQLASKITGLISTVQELTPGEREAWIYVTEKLLDGPMHTNSYDIDDNLLAIHKYALGLVSYAELKGEDWSEATRFIDYGEKALH